MNAEALRRELLALLPRLRRYAYALTGSGHDADDLLQATVERMLSKGVTAPVEVDKFVFRVCRNIWIDEIRSRKVRAAVPLEEPGAQEQSFDGERAVMGKLALMEVGDAMEELPEEQRAALSLVVLEGLSYAQAAEVLETPIGTIMSRIARARAALASALRREPHHAGRHQAAGGRS